MVATALGIVNVVPAVLAPGSLAILALGDQPANRPWKSAAEPRSPVVWVAFDLVLVLPHLCRCLTRRLSGGAAVVGGWHSAHCAGRSNRRLDVGRDNLPTTEEASRTWPKTLAPTMPITAPERPERWFALQAVLPKSSAAAAPSAKINERTAEARKRRSLMSPCRAERNTTAPATAKARRPSIRSAMPSTALYVDDS